MQYAHHDVGGKRTSVGKKLEGVIQREEVKLHFKLNTIKSVKACDAFPCSDKIIRVSYCTAMIPFVFSPSFFRFTIFHNLTCAFVLLSERKAPCKLTQHCFQPTTPNIVGCYMLRPFPHPVACCCVLLGVVASVCTPMSNNVESCCVCLHVAFIRLVFGVNC